MTSCPRAQPVIRSEALRQLYRYGDDRQAGRAMPARAAIDPLDIPRLLPSLLLFDVEPGTERMKARLVGTRIADMYGLDYTGRYLDEIDFGERRAAILHDYTTCLRSRQVYVSEHSFWTIPGATFRVERLILPLSEDGETVSMLLAGLGFEAVP
jgi:hypothetical protein